MPSLPGIRDSVALRHSMRLAIPEPFARYFYFFLPFSSFSLPSFLFSFFIQLTLFIRPSQDPTKKWNSTIYIPCNFYLESFCSFFSICQRGTWFHDQSRPKVIRRFQRILEELNRRTTAWIRDYQVRLRVLFTLGRTTRIWSRFRSATECIERLVERVPPFLNLIPYSARRRRNKKILNRHDWLSCTLGALYFPFLEAVPFPFSFLSFICVRL